MAFASIRHSCGSQAQHILRAIKSITDARYGSLESAAKQSNGPLAFVAKQNSALSRRVARRIDIRLLLALTAEP